MLEEADLSAARVRGHHCRVHSGPGFSSEVDGLLIGPPG